MQLLNATRDILSGLKNILQQIETSKYNQSVGTLSDSTIGQHTRHTIEFFQNVSDKRLERKLKRQEG